MRRLLLCLALATFARAHFVLQVPPSLGFDDDNEGTAPCGGFNISNRANVTSWPLAGAPLQAVTTHPSATWEIRCSLLNNTNDFVYMVPPIDQQGLGTICLPAVPGIAAWSGQDAVLQVTQTAADGVLFQCAAIHFTDGSAAAVPDSCKNSSGIVASYTTAASSSTVATSTAAATTSKAAAAGPIQARGLAGWLALAAPLLGWLL